MTGGQSTWLIASTLALATACVPEADDHEALDPAPMLDEDEDFRVHFDTIFDHFEYLQDGTDAAGAIGSVRDPVRNGSGTPQTVDGYDFRTTCGVTFISPHYAVTAAHCVDRGDPTLHPVTVETYDISSISLFALWAASHVEGSFPDYDPVVDVRDFAGYEVERYSCSIRSRCDSGSFNCSFTADIALLHCAGRSSSAPWIPIASSDPTTGPVENYWVHEVLSIPTGAPSTAEELDRHEHYTTYRGDEIAENYHYLEGAASALLPLKSTDWPARQGGGPRTRVGGIDAIGSRISTDLFGCHGTSGSGVFQRDAAGALELLGPVATGANAWARDRLCADPNAIAPGQTLVTYTANASTRQLQANYFLTLFFDRNPPVVYPTGPGTLPAAP